MASQIVHGPGVCSIIIASIIWFPPFAIPHPELGLSFRVTVSVSLLPGGGGFFRKA